MYKNLNGKSFINYGVKEYLEEKFRSECFYNEQYVLYTDKF